MTTRAHKFWIMSLGVVILVGLAGADLCAAEPTAATPTKVAGAPGMQGAVYRFFDDNTGERTGELRIGRVDMEYRRQGFLRVAWRPLVVLEKVDFDFTAAMAWPVQGSQIVRALEKLGGRDELVLRDVRVHLAGETDRELTAATARLAPGGALVLAEATLSEGGAAATPSGTYRLELTGANAGRLARSVPLRRKSETLSASNSLTQLSP